ncbi:MAG TPA: PRC-barrel domain-containing protein [Opitutaceae bacterium]|nr:PRC-barrel domain-containing protein [Opitutaceae bacterium]
MTCAGFTAVHAQTQTQQFPGRNGRSGQVSPLANLHKALPETENFGLNKFAGKPLRGANQEQLGTVSDFLLETESGKIRYALVPASAESFRLVPVGALDRTSSNEALVVRISRDQWNRVGTLTEVELPGRLTLSADQEQRSAQAFGVYGPAAGTSNDLTRASKWKGQTVHTGGYQLGSVDDIIVDIPSRTAAALVRTTGGYPANVKFVVPFDRLQLTGDGNAPISTTLTRADFQTAQGAFQPTGATSTQYGQQPSYGQIPQHAPQAPATQYGQPNGSNASDASSAATTVQQALSRNPSLRYGAGIQVQPETRLVLRGVAQNESQRQAIENTARQSAPNMVIENQITLQGR